MSRKAIAAWALLVMGCLAAAGVERALAARKSRFRSGSASGRYTKPAPDEQGRPVIYRQRTTIDLDDSLLEGEVKNPTEFYFVHRPEQKFGTLVKKRKHFHKEMLRDSVMMR